MSGRIPRALAFFRDNERLGMVMITTALVMAGQGVISPVLPLFAHSFGVGVTSVGLTLTVFALARLVLNVPLGMLADRHGRRLLLVGGPLVTAAGMVGSGLATDIASLLAARALAGAGSAMYMTGAQIYLADISTDANRARIIAANQGALLAGVSIGPALGGLLADGFGFRVPFHVVGVAAVVAAGYAWARLPETRHRAHGDAGGGDDGPEPARWRQVMRAPGFLAVSCVTASVFLTRAGGRMTLMPLLAAAELGYGAAGIGAVFTVMAAINLAGLTPAAHVADRFGRKAAIVPSGLVAAAGLAALALASSHAAFLAGALLLALGTSIIGPAPAAYAADIAPPRLRGLAMGLYRSAGDVGFVAGPVLLGALADATSIAWALVVNAALMAAAALLFGVAARETAGARGRTRAPSSAAGE